MNEPHWFFRERCGATIGNPRCSAKLRIGSRRTHKPWWPGTSYSLMEWLAYCWARLLNRGVCTQQVIPLDGTPVRYYFQGERYQVHFDRIVMPRIHSFEKQTVNEIAEQCKLPPRFFEEPKC